MSRSALLDTRPPIAPPEKDYRVPLPFSPSYLPVSNPTLFARLLNRGPGEPRANLSRQPFLAPSLRTFALVPVYSGSNRPAEHDMHTRHNQTIAVFAILTHFFLFFNFSLSLPATFLCTIVTFLAAPYGWRLYYKLLYLFLFLFPFFSGCVSGSGCVLCRLGSI
ncbi:uncharacterized protein P884DRAFT_5207 [Thermothelomyces heterothallicus CBS 202.75]|uniref:uncharacterized protein n=1 Tax=Thermothelomyces heterothallicus CBS 202.75 TaxID=1149848 RepID=UPI003743E2ED